MASSRVEVECCCGRAVVGIGRIVEGGEVAGEERIGTGCSTEDFVRMFKQVAIESVCCGENAEIGDVEVFVGLIWRDRADAMLGRRKVVELS